jgi:hypothetical protein
LYQNFHILEKLKKKDKDITIGIHDRNDLFKEKLIISYDIN